jgi:hypothetical protein
MQHNPAELLYTANLWIPKPCGFEFADIYFPKTATL